MQEAHHSVEEPVKNQGTHMRDPFSRRVSVHAPCLYMPYRKKHFRRVRKCGTANEGLNRVFSVTYSKKSLGRNPIAYLKYGALCKLTIVEPNRTGTHGTQCRLAPTARSHTGLSLAPLGRLSLSLASLTLLGARESG